MSKKIPPLTNDPKDFGKVYMIGHHRKAMLERLGEDVKKIPTSKSEQEKMLMLYKADDYEKYNECFDIVVRKIDTSKPSITLPEELMDEARIILGDYCINLKSEIALHNQKVNESYENNIENICDNHVNKLRKISNRVENQIKKAVEDVKRVEHIAVIQNEKGKTLKELKAIVPECFQDVLDLAQQRINVLLVGPAGCGKTHLAKIVADSLGLDYSGQSCSAGMSESIFSGWLLPTGESGKFNYVQSEFVRLYENGGVFLFDELDAADPNVMLFLNQALANDHFALPQRYENPIVKKHPDFVAIAAANTFGNGATALYSGRNLMDGATMDRFRAGIIPMDYSPVVEEALIEKEILESGRMLRRIIEKHSMRKILSTRFLIDATKLKNHGWKYKKIFMQYFKDWSQDQMRLIQNDGFLYRLDKMDDPTPPDEDALSDDEEFIIGEEMKKQRGW